MDKLSPTFLLVILRLYLGYMWLMSGIDKINNDLNITCFAEVMQMQLLEHPLCSLFPNTPLDGMHGL